MDYKIPEFLYKYTSCSTAKLILRNKTIRWNSPLNFNDIFELNHSLGMDFEETKAVNIIAQKLAAVIYDDEIQLYDTGKKNPKLDYMRRNLRKDSYPIEQLVETIKLVAREFIPTVKNIIESERIRWRKDIENYRILCFSEFNDSDLMWKRYSDQHSGVVLQWKPIATIDSTLLVARPVVYSDDIPEVATFEYFTEVAVGLKPMVSTDDLSALTTIKATSWSDENEWRIVSTNRIYDSGDHEDVPFSAQEINSVYLGCQIDNKDKKVILKYIDENFSHVNVYQAYIDEDTRVITFKNI
ncbi:MAG: DUF2971 domain-containing protein [Nitrospinae bacterium]|nr:DUF2971 domain-containing protein [Nitrospinota bacterium]